MGVRRIDLSGMAADLAQPQETRENVEPHLVERPIRFDAQELKLWIWPAVPVGNLQADRIPHDDHPRAGDGRAV